MFSSTTESGLPRNGTLRYDFRKKKRKSKSGKQNKRRIKGGLDVIALWRCQDQFYAKYFDVQSHITLHEGNQNAMK